MYCSYSTVCWENISFSQLKKIELLFSYLCFCMAIPYLFTLLGIRVAVVQFSHLGTFEAIRLNDPTIDSLSNFRNALKSLQWIAGGTWTPSALKFTHDTIIHQGRRTWARMAVIVITDGMYDIRDQPHSHLWTLCNDHSIDVLALGVRDHLNSMPFNSTLQYITCNRTQRIMTFTHYTDLFTDCFTQEVERVLCPGISL